MSACISRHGEYSEHEYELGSPDCVLCGNVDENVALANAWDEGRKAGVDDMIAAELGTFRRRKPNPYRNEVAA